MGKLGNIFGGVGNGVNSNPMNMFMQLMNGNMNPQQMMDSMIQQNPQMKQFLTQAQAMTQGKSSQEMEQMVKQLCQQKGIDFDQAQGLLQNFMKNKK